MASEQNPPASSSPERPSGAIARALNAVERVGNLLPDPALLFVLLLVAIWVISALLSPVAFSEIDPRNKEALKVVNLLSGPELARLLAEMVKIFTGFHPLGVVLVALLGVGVAEHTGFINAGLKAMLAVTPRVLLTPMLIAVGLLSHTAADAGYVLVIPLGGVIFHAAGRHPLAGIAAAFAGVSGGFSACFIPTSLDPLLQGFTQAAAQIIDPKVTVNPLGTYYFTTASSLLVILVGWLVTARVIEPRLKSVTIDGDGAEMPKMEALTPAEKRGLIGAFVATALSTALLILAVAVEGSPLRSKSGLITAGDAPLMQGIVPLIFLFFLIPGVTYGALAGSVKSHRDVVKGMSKSMSTMGYYIVLAFFVSLFIDAFTRSNLGALLALKGAAALQATALPVQLTIVGIILLTATVNLAIGSASAKWALLSPIFVPMLMQLGLAPELTWAAYRVGDSTTNIITPLMPYFPLVVVFCTRYVKSSGIGTLLSLMIPYSFALLASWSIFLLLYWAVGAPLGVQATYVYPRP